MKNKSLKEIYDSFEKKELSDIWDTRKIEQGALKIQSKIVRRGKGAVKITIHKGDTFESGKGKHNDTERDELLEQPYLWIKERAPYSYSFSIFIPKKFPIVPTRLVLAQWKQWTENSNVLLDNPILAIRYSDENLRITLQTQEEKINLFRKHEEIRGKWIDFVFHIKFTRTKNGFIKAWINKNQVVDYKGVTAYSEKYNYPKNGSFYFKMGLYRDMMKEPMTIYIDEFRKKKL